MGFKHGLPNDFCRIDPSKHCLPVATSGRRGTAVGCFQFRSNQTSPSSSGFVARDSRSTAALDRGLTKNLPLFHFARHFFRSFQRL